MIQLRKATLNDLATLKYWDTQPHVINADPNDDWNWAFELSREPEWRLQLIAELNGHPIGFVQIIDPANEETHYWGEIAPNKRAIDIWIGEQQYLGKGYGTMMMRQALERCFEHPAVEEVFIDPLESNQDAIRFYQKLGFKYLEKRVFGADSCAVYSIKRKDWRHKTR